MSDTMGFQAPNQTLGQIDNERRNVALRDGSRRSSVPFADKPIRQRPIKMPNQQCPGSAPTRSPYTQSTRAQHAPSVGIAPHVSVSDAFALLAHEPTSGQRLKSYTAGWVYKACAIVDLLHTGHLQLLDSKLYAVRSETPDDAVARLVLNSMVATSQVLTPAYVIRELAMGDEFEDTVVNSLTQRSLGEVTHGEALGGQNFRCIAEIERNTLKENLLAVLVDGYEPDFRLSGLIVLLDYFHVLADVSGVPRWHYQNALLAMKERKQAPAVAAPLEASTSEQIVPPSVASLHDVFTEAVLHAAG